MTLTLKQAQTTNTIRAGIISRLKLAHGAVHFRDFTEEQQAELKSLASLGLIMSLPNQLYTVIQPGKGRR